MVKGRPGQVKTTQRGTVEDQKLAAEWQLRAAVRTLGTNRSGWKENVKALNAF